jgi:hypothetical protein
MNIETVKSLMSFGDVLFLLALVVLVMLKAGEDLGLLFRRESKYRSISSARDPNTPIGLIGRLNYESNGSYQWISRDIGHDPERFLVKPLQEVFEVNLDMLFVATTFFEASAGETLLFRECYSKIVSTRGKVMDAVLHNYVFLIYCSYSLLRGQRGLECSRQYVWNG